MIQLEPTLLCLRERFGLMPRSTDEARLSHHAEQLARKRRQPVEEVLIRAREDRALQLELATALTIEESYFFRQYQHFEFVAHMMRDRLGQSRFGPFRVWSAGCSGGDEAHSVAIMAHEHVPTQEHSRIEVLGTDIDELSLARARSGRVSRWSLRSIEPHLLQKYFHCHGTEHVLEPSVRKLVKFHHLSLLEHAQSMPSSSVDVVFFRNVAIYLEQRMLSALWREFARILTPEGRLLVAATDPRPDGCFAPLLKSDTCSAFRPLPPDSEDGFPSSEVGSSVRPISGFNSMSAPQRALSAPRPAPLPSFASDAVPPTVPPPRRASRSGTPSTVEEARSAADQGQAAQALAMLDELIAERPRDPSALLLRGQLYLSLSELTLAEPDLAQAVETAPHLLEARYWFAVCLGDAGEQERARQQLEVIRDHEATARTSSEQELLRAAESLHGRLA